MASRYVALIRGINVGRAKRIAMADLRTLLAELGYVDVRTILNSGNVVFSASNSSRAALASGWSRRWRSGSGCPAALRC